VLSGFLRLLAKLAIWNYLSTRKHASFYNVRAGATTDLNLCLGHARPWRRSTHYQRVAGALGLDLGDPRGNGGRTLPGVENRAVLGWFLVSLSDLAGRLLVIARYHHIG
jgi:hypothetical protein